MPRYCFFFCQSSRYVSNKQPCLKATGLHEDLLLLSSLFHYFYFKFNAPISFMFSSFSISSSFFFFDVLYQACIKHSRKVIVYIYRNNMYNIYILESMSRTRLSDFTSTFHFHALEKEMATHSSVLAWRIPGTGESGGLPSLGSHRIRHD